MKETDIKRFESIIDNLLNNNSISNQEIAVNEESLSQKKKKQKKIPEKKKSKKAEISNQNEISDLEIVICIYKLLLFDFKKYSNRWNYSSLIKYVSNQKTNIPNKQFLNENDLCKWFSLKIFSLLLCLTPNEEDILLKRYFSDSDQLSTLNFITYELFSNEELRQDNLIQLKNETSIDLSKIRTNFSKTNLEKYKYYQEDDDSLDEDNKNIANKFVEFDKIKLRQKKQRADESNNENFETKNIVFVESTKKNLNRLAMSVITDNCIFVEGELSSGKTTLIEYLALKTNNKLIKYQMDDFMDSKSLIGNYICSDIPGEFIWKPGPLCQAVSHGYWILLEDIDHAPIDSLSLIIDLLETKTIKTSDNIINMKLNFRLFLTIRPSDGKRANSTFIDSIKKQSRFVLLDELSDDEITKIIAHKHPHFSSNKIGEKLLDVYRCLDLTGNKGNNFLTEDSTNLITSNLVRDARLLSLRDLLKLCNRLTGVKNIDQHKLILLLIKDIYECFLTFISNKKARTELAIRIGCKFNINKDEITNLLFNERVNFQKKDNQILCGRVKLNLNEQEKEDILSKSSFLNFGQKFVYTKSALSLLEKIARCIECNEPVLLCGETGVGKTSALQHLARLLGKTLNIINLNHQTETSDLLGSFKPVDIKSQLKIVKDRFVALFTRCFKIEENQTFLNHIQNCFSSSNWKYLIKLILHATKSACDKFSIEKNQYLVYKEWKDLKASITKLDENLESIIDKFSFQFFEGKLSQAIVNGEWIILDEINLASSETLQFLSTLLEDTYSRNSSIILYEKGDDEPLRRHPDFRLFGAMNPANDIGKRNLPSNIRNRFTEIFVDELDDEHDLNLLIRSYLECLNDVTNDLVKSIVNFYLSLKQEGFLKKLSNGVGMPPTYSLRTLCRALKNASLNQCNNTLLSVYDSLCLSFLTDLNRESSLFLEEYIRNSILKSAKLKNKIQRVKPNAELFQDPTSQKSRAINYINIEDYWLLKGPNECVDSTQTNESSYIFTKSAKDNLKRIARVCSARLPCLIQGDTSIGKTSLIKWLAEATGNVLIRINNHDHTDLQEYIGSYVVDPTTSKLVFKEGLLVKAMRNGYWILLDELNLASSEVLEALNRVLDDNRELYIPETQDVIRAHPRFLLFATQNPPGKYAGRKQLSRAFRNRFIELHFDELPDDELLIIVEKKCSLPKTYATLLIKTITELKTKRSQMSGIFLGKNSLITLRDLFRWARRFSMSKKLDGDCDDWKQYLAEQGFIILSSRCRAEEDVQTIHATIQKVFNKKIDINNLNNPQTFCLPIMSVLNKMIEYSSVHCKDFVWTPSARRLALLTGLCYKFNEPFLLVGGTGLGKTTICQILSNLTHQHLHIINCHMHSEAADFLGSIRPVREEANVKDNQLFEWNDGPLITAIKNGDDFLIDEISLADDSVLERLNSILEEERTLLLAENINENSYSLKAHENFRIFATMNPSGDFGKKELSAALRNRFTEIWCPTPSNNSEEFQIICKNTLFSSVSTDDIPNIEVTREICTKTICEFLNWLGSQPFFRKSATSSSGSFSIRDLIAWVSFINKTSLIQIDSSDENYEELKNISPILYLIHGACLVFIDSINIETGFVSEENSRVQCMNFLFKTIQDFIEINDQQFQLTQSIQSLFSQSLNNITNDTDYFKCGPFSIRKGNLIVDINKELNYCINSATTAANLQRIMRCLLMDSPIMLEGSPGVGKTSLVEALAKITRNKVVRINLSEQTDLNELFGADLPVSTTDSNKNQQRFDWHDGPFLLALKQGNWVILDEINLASQSVLEGLNSCFDHRSEIFISELNKRFTVDKTRTKIFACQNPFSQGGGRKGLPKSFLNRFSKVYIDQMTHDDLLFIASNMYAPSSNKPCGIDPDCLSKMIRFNDRINREVCIERKWGNVGSPWEFNLRDLFRWCDLIVKDQELSDSKAKPENYVYLIYASRFRSNADREKCYEFFNEIFGYYPYRQDQSQVIHFTNTHLQIGQSLLEYKTLNNRSNDCSTLYASKYSFTSKNLKYLEAISKCIDMNWMVILVGKSCVGKTSLVRMLASLMSKKIIEFSVNNSTDTSDLLGGYEKVRHFKKDIENLYQHIKSLYMKALNGHKNPDLLLKDYFQFVFESNHLFKVIFNMDEDLKTIEKLITLYEINLDKLTKYKVDLGDYKTVYERIKDNFINKSKSNAKSDSMKFEWVDSSLVKAIEQGDWVLIDNANFCVPSVLDRLNPLLERNGSLQINEKGIEKDGGLNELKPHPNFRIILSMNESFGELSRPMRNRGVEIYMDELSVDSDSDDIRILLDTLYPFNIEKNILDKLYFKVFNLNIKQGRFNSVQKRISFVEILKIVKMTYDYWLIDVDKNDGDISNCLNNCFERAIYDLRLNIDDSNIDQLQMIEYRMVYYSDAFRLRENALYRFNYNMPLYSRFISHLSDYFMRLNKHLEYNLEDYSEIFLITVKNSEFINLWIRNIPLDSLSLVLKHTRSILSSNLPKSNKFTIQMDIFFNAYINELFELNKPSLNEKEYPKVFNSLLKIYDQIRNDIHIELDEIDPSSNQFLIEKLRKLSTGDSSKQETLNNLRKVNSYFKFLIEFYLSKYRMNECYSVQNNSLVTLVKQLDSNMNMMVKRNQNETGSKQSFKFVSLINEAYEELFIGIFNYLVNQARSYEDYDSGLVKKIRNLTHLFEKFYLISICKFDSVLTLSYLKYFWNFIQNYLNEIQNEYLPNCLSAKFQTFNNLFNQNLYFDDSVYKKFYELWLDFKPAHIIYDQTQLDIINQVNNQLVNKYIFNSSFNLNTKKLLECLQTINNFDYLQSIFNEKYSKINLTKENVYSLSEVPVKLEESLSKIDLEEGNLNNSIKFLHIKSQLLPIHHYANTISELKRFNETSSYTNAKQLFSIKNLNEFITKDLVLGKFYSFFKQMTTKCFEFVDVLSLILKMLANNLNQFDPDEKINELEHLEKMQSIEQQENTLVRKIINSNISQLVESMHKTKQNSFIHYNWLDQYISSIYTNRFEVENSHDRRKSANSDGSYIFSIQLIMSLYDHRISSLNELGSFIWSNYSFLVNDCYYVKSIDSSLVTYTRSLLNDLKAKYFADNDQILNEYLIKKGFDGELLQMRVDLLQLVRKNKNIDSSVLDLVELVIYGCVISYMFSPVDPLDPLEHTILIDKTNRDEVEIDNFSSRLELANKSKLKYVEITDEDSSVGTNFPLRANKPDYFLIKNEIDEALKQFCSKNQLKSLLNKFLFSNIGENDEQQFSTWMMSLEKFVDKLMNTHCSYTDIVYPTINGVSLIGYAMNALHTYAKTSHNDSKIIPSLIKLLYKYPNTNSHLGAAAELKEYSKQIMNLNGDIGINEGINLVELSDEINLLCLLHYFLETERDNNKIFFDTCNYYCERFKLYNEIKEKNANIETYKYKEYGQKEIEQELEQKEMEQAFPTYTNNFQEFIVVNTLEDAPKPAEIKTNDEPMIDQNKMINIDLLSQTYALIELITDDQYKNKHKNTVDQLVLRTFFRSYSIGASLMQKFNLEMPVNDSKSNFSLLSHVLFSSTVKSNAKSFNVNSVLENSNDNLYNIYHDSNYEQVLSCKNLLVKLSQRLESLLTDWPNNPILVEIGKIKNRIESFNLNDPLMKYLTGLELLLEKAEAWQQLAAQRFSLETELKAINSLVVEWRKLELKFWLNSLDIEHNEIKKRTGYVWFYNIFAVCVEFISNLETEQEKEEPSRNELINTLKQFIDTSSIGEYFIRLRNLKICSCIFENLGDMKINKNRLEYLLTALYSVGAYYDTIYSKIIAENIETTKKQIHKELKDFVDIYKWQDHNYWALKQSTAKSNKTLFKTIRKYRSFLNQKIKFEDLISLSKFNASLIAADKQIVDYLNKNFKMNIQRSANIESDKFKNYDQKMEKFCRKILNKKFARNKFNKSIADFSMKTYVRYNELEKETKHLLNNSIQTSKEGKEKFKKDAKSLNNLKCKYISDLLKKLNQAGISYRKGSIYYSHEGLLLKDILLFEMSKFSNKYLENNRHYGTNFLNLFEKSEYNYYLCTSSYFSFKFLYVSQNTSKDFTAIPVQQFAGYADHFYHIVHEQKIKIHDISKKVFEFETLKEITQIILKSKLFDSSNFTGYANLKKFMHNTSSLIDQIELFFINITSETIKVESVDSQMSVVKSSYDSIRDQMSKLKSYLSINYNSSSTCPSEIERYKLVFDENDNFKKFYEVFATQGSFHQCLSDLHNLTKINCKPFENVLEKITEDFSKLSKENVQDLNPDFEEDFELSLEGLKDKIVNSLLKSIENIFKKYMGDSNSSENSSSDFDNKGDFIKESYTNFSDDLGLFNLNKINRLLKKFFQVIDDINPNEDRLNKIQGELKTIGLFLDIYSSFISKWMSYLINTHLESTKCLNVLLYVFSEFKNKGLQTPQETEEDKSEEKEKNSKKFETQDQDATGLGEGEGAKDVSDQIENEDQLDDAKRPEDREDDKEGEEKEEKKIKEEENGIEMSEDFEADMEDDNPEEKEENDKKEEGDDEKDEEELDDQKGSVDDANDALDKQLWDEENKKDDDEEEENDNIEENADGGEPLQNKEGQLSAKDDDIPMIDNEENRESGENDDEDVEMNPDLNDNEDEPLENEDEQNDDKEQKQKEEKEANLLEEQGIEENNDNDQTEDGKDDEKEGELNSDDEDADEKPNDNVQKLEEIPDEEEKDDQASENSKNTNSKEPNTEQQQSNQQKNQTSAAVDNSNVEKDEKEENEIDEINENENEKDDKNFKSDSSGNNKKVSEPDENDSENTENEQKEKNIGKKNEDRSASENDKQDNNENANLMDMSDEENDENSENKMDDDSDKNRKRDYRHMKKNSNEKHDKEMFDAATESQKRKINENRNENESHESGENEPKKIHSEKEKNQDEIEKSKLLDTEKTPKNNTAKSNENSQEEKEEESMNVDPNNDDYVKTSTVEGRPLESFHSTNLEKLKIEPISREQVENDLIQFRSTINVSDSTDLLTSESLKLWLEYESITDQLSKELCEQLRLILEPTICSKLKGDYKTGKRLNMKRVVEYIATEYRKDKIWLRRTKPNKRDYQVLLAVDNSSSMSDNHCMQLAYETIATLTNAFNFLEVGQFGLVSFGEKVNELHNLQAQFNTDVGARVLSQVNFKDDRTNIAEMLNVVTDIFNNSQTRNAKSTSSNVPISKLLIILSDGRGIFYEGIERVKTAVQTALLQGIFIVFVILDIPGRNSSIFDIKMPIYTEGNPIPAIKSYMENFPFPFYVVLREINNLPIIMIEALKQWFEMVTRIES